MYYFLKHYRNIDLLKVIQSGTFIPMIFRSQVLFRKDLIQEQKVRNRVVVKKTETAKLIETELDEALFSGVSTYYDISSSSSITTIGPPTGDEFFTTKTTASVSSVSRFYMNFRSINKHSNNQ